MHWLTGLHRQIWMIVLQDKHSVLKQVDYEKGHLEDKGIKEDSTALYNLHLKTDCDSNLTSLEWQNLIQHLYDEAEKHGLDETVDNAYIERSYKGILTR